LALPPPSGRGGDGLGSVPIPAPARPRNDAAVSSTRQFVVVARGEDRRGELRHVQAATHEEAVALIVVPECLTEAGVEYEVWPAADPGAVLRVTLGPPGLRRPSPS
jgi:hypothetical protein